MRIAAEAFHYMHNSAGFIPGRCRLLMQAKCGNILQASVHIKEFKVGEVDHVLTRRSSPSHNVDALQFSRNV